MLVVATACGGTPSGPTTPPPVPSTPAPTAPSAAASSLVVSAPPPVVVAHAEQLRAHAVFPDGSTPDVTSETTWRCEDEAICTVSAAGVLTAIGGGRTTVTAKWKALSSSVPVTAGYLLTAVVHEAAPTASRTLSDVVVHVVGGALQ